jgi:hypothetical protein
MTQTMYAHMNLKKKKYLKKKRNGEIPLLFPFPSSFLLPVLQIQWLELGKPPGPQGIVLK